MATDKITPIIHAGDSNGWKSKKTEKPDGVELVMIRNGEIMVLRWSGSRFVGKESTHTLGMRSVRVKNAAAALRFIAEDPDVTEKHVREVTSRKIDEDDDEDVLPIRLPFPLEEAEDEEIISAVIGRKIVWRNNGKYHEAHVLKKRDQKYLRIESAKSGRAITFCAEDAGFTSVYLNRIVQIV